MVLIIFLHSTLRNVTLIKTLKIFICNDTYTYYEKLLILRLKEPMGVLTAHPIEIEQDIKVVFSLCFESANQAS